MIKKLISILLIINAFSLNAQQAETDSLKTGRMLLVGGLTMGGFVYAYGIQNTMWWKGEKSGFHTNWQEDWTTSLGADKFGHFYFGYLVSNVYSQAFRWTGMSREKSILYSSLFAFTYQTFLEVRDGFSEKYGFSWGDFAANALGCGYPLLQEKYPLLKNFNFKVSYRQSERYKNGSHSHIIDDYESTYLWMSIDINKLLPSDVEKYIPDFINIAVGHSVKRLDFEGRHEFFIGLDWNLEALPGDNWFLKFLKKNLNFYHLPAPTIKIYPDVVWYGLKF